jgi:hypothetical protein
MTPTKCSQLVLLTLALARADTDQESTFNEVKETKAIITFNDVTYTPPMLILGKENGEIFRCPHATPTSCELYHSGNSAVLATAVHGEYLFAALESGAMLRCSWQKRHSCSVFHAADSEMTGLAVVAGYIHAGLRNGTILRCSMNSPHSCRSFADIGKQVCSLAASASSIYVGSEETQIYRCNISGGSCSLFCTGNGTQRLTGIAVVGDRVYGVNHNGYLHSGNAGSNVCDTVSLFGVHYTNMAVYDKKLYMVNAEEEIRMKVPGTGDNIDTVFANLQAVSISFSYGMHAIQDKYRMESVDCLWKGVVRCPPTVVYYDVHRRLPLEVSVKDGRLVDSQGVLVDTSDADEAHGHKAAIFVMGPDGQILLSKVHEAGRFHTSSLLAGNPVSGAGLMVVEQGKIKNITACSAHYMPDQDLNKQVEDSLWMKGYTDPIDSKLCTYSDWSCNVNNLRVSSNVV